MVTTWTGAAIYRQSFAIIRSEANLSAFSSRCRERGGADDPRLRPGRSGRRRGGPWVVAAARAHWKPVPRFCAMQTRSPPVSPGDGLPVDNDVLCFLEPGLAGTGSTPGIPPRTAAALEYWKPLLAGSVVAIGSPPTALFALLDPIDAGADKPAAIVGAPVRVHRQLLPNRGGSPPALDSAAPHCAWTAWWFDRRLPRSNALASTSEV